MFFKNHYINGHPICFKDTSGNETVLEKDQTIELLNGLINGKNIQDLIEPVRLGRLRNLNRETHKWTGGHCPCCGFPLKETISNGHIFCSNHESICDYDQPVRKTKSTT